MQKGNRLSCISRGKERYFRKSEYPTSHGKRCFSRGIPIADPYTRLLFLDGVYIDGPNAARFRWVKAPSSTELTALAHTMAQPIGRFLERQGLPCDLRAFELHRQAGRLGAQTQSGSDSLPRCVCLHCYFHPTQSTSVRSLRIHPRN